MTGPLTWKDTTALPADTAGEYFLTATAFTSGGTTKYITRANAVTSLDTAHKWVRVAGDTMTGGLTVNGATIFKNNVSLYSSDVRATAPSSNTYRYLTFRDSAGDPVAIIRHGHNTNNNHTLQFYVYDSAGNETSSLSMWSTGGGEVRISAQTRPGADDTYNLGTSSYKWKNIYGTSVYGAVWNDYAEYRQSEIKEPGRCIQEVGNDTLQLTQERLLPGCEIISDTFGFAIGETVDSKTPVATSGRVLAYPYESREEFKLHIGAPVCSGPEGTVSIMTPEEEMKYPSRIIGTISAVPEYERWGSGNVEINGRVWIRIR